MIESPHQVSTIAIDFGGTRIKAGVVRDGCVAALRVLDAESRGGLAARLPVALGAPLRPIPVADGWLGDRSNGAISPYACFPSNRSSASWSPSR